MYNRIKRLTDGVYPFHMPGHKRNPDFLKSCPDITEITGADDLHHPEGIIAVAENRASGFFGVKRTLFATSGSTACILAAITAAAKSGSTIIIARNCHKSVYNAAYINSLKTEYIMPETVQMLDCCGAVSAASVEAALSRTAAAAVVITSPTYEGFVSDIEAIAEVTHKANALLIVDAAHGAHLGLSDRFLPSARNLGADIVIESAHKTLPSLTGAALLHICSDRVDEEAVKRAFSVYQSSSPSYPIMASIDAAVKELSYRGADLFKAQASRLDGLYSAAGALRHLSLFRRDDHDKTKIVICCKRSNISGFELKQRLLAEHRIECEMAMPAYVLAISTVADTALGFDKLCYALTEIDRTLADSDEMLCINKLPPPAVKMTLRAAAEADVTPTPIDFAVGRISADYIYAYPPGSPIIAPGEMITATAVSFVKALSKAGANVYSSSGSISEIKTIK